MNIIVCDAVKVHFHLIPPNKQTNKQTENVYIFAF